MMPVPTTADVDRLSRLVALRLGRQFGETRPDLLQEMLSDRLSSTRQSAASYLNELETGTNNNELQTLASRLTVTETYFFRHIEQLHAMSAVALPERLAAGKTKLRLLSAGCASGEEAYSLAIVAEHALGAAATVAIDGWDTNPDMIERARRGRYSEWALRQTSKTVRDTSFVQSGRDSEIAARYRDVATFSLRNLLDSSTYLGVEAYDVIFCRNVLMYFSLEQGRTVLAGLASVLAPGGWLFLGHAETARDQSDDFELCSSHGVFYYRKHGGSMASLPPPARPSADPLLPPQAVVEARDWAQLIQDSSARIAVLARPAKPEPAPWRLDDVVDALRNERYGEGLARLDALPETAQGDPQVLELRAVLLTDTGDGAGAEIACRRLLDRDDCHAGAHYLLALGREQAGDLAGARAHDHVAAALSPGFAMPHMHLGLMARKAGDMASARQSFLRAEALLAAEASVRLLLYGGGFGRAALIAVCRNQRSAAGDR